MSDLIKVENLSYSKKGIPILKKINFSLQKGQHLAIMGQSGAGKSLLGQILAVDILPKFGSYLSILGSQIGKTNLWQLRKKIGLVSNRQMENFEGRTKIIEIIASGFSGFYENQTILTNLELDQIEKVLGILKINNLKDSLFGNLSDGEKRKVLLARAIVNNPELLVLDEPAQGLDIPSRENLLSILEKISLDLTIIYITHHSEELPRNITHLLLLKNGQVYEFGELEKTLSSKNLSAVFDYDLNVRKVGQKYFLQY